MNFENLLKSEPKIIVAQFFPDTVYICDTAIWRLIIITTGKSKQSYSPGSRWAVTLITE